MIRIALDARETSHTSIGMRNYVRALGRWLPRVAPDLTIIPFGSGDNFDVDEQLGMPLALRRVRPQLAHFTSPYVPLWRPVPYVMTIHDVIDLEFPAYAKRSVGPYYRIVVGPALRGARRVITDDTSTADALVTRLHVDPQRIRIIPLGVEPHPDPVIPRIEPRPYILAVGNRRPHKNLVTLLAAWAALPASLGVDLMLSGEDDGNVQAATAPGAVHFLGDLSEADLQRAYAGAEVLAHPALREGFGLPMLEALAVGTPVIASRTAVPRVLASAVTQVDALDVRAWTLALERILAEPAAARALVGERVEMIRALSWEATARATADVYREAIA